MAKERERGTTSEGGFFARTWHRLTTEVWAEFKETGLANCRTCHVFMKEIFGKEKEFVRSMHEQVLASAATCTDPHKGIAHTAPQE